MSLLVDEEDRLLLFEDATGWLGRRFGPPLPCKDLDSAEHVVSTANRHNNKAHTMLSSFE